MFYAHVASTNRLSLPQKNKNNSSNSRGECWNLQIFLKDLNPQSAISGHNSSRGFSSNNSSSNNAPPKRGSGERHMCQNVIK